IDATGKEIARLETEYTFYNPLTNDEIAQLIAILRERQPPSEDFGELEAENRRVRMNAIIPGTGKYTPSTEEEIREYQKFTYPRWLSACEYFFKMCHRDGFSSPFPGFCLVGENNGTRPAEDALIKIEARGDFQIVPPPETEETEETDSKGKTKQRH